MQVDILLHAGWTCSDGSIVQATALGCTSGLLIGLGRTHQVIGFLWLQRSCCSIALKLLYLNSWDLEDWEFLLYRQFIS